MYYLFIYNLDKEWEEWISSKDLEFILDLEKELNKLLIATGIIGW